jgi:hypothetical protein
MSTIFQIKTIDSMIYGKLRCDTAHVTTTDIGADVEALLSTRHDLMHGIDCFLPKYSADAALPLAQPATDAFVPMPAGAPLAMDFGLRSGHWQDDDAAAPSLLTNAADNTGPAPTLPPLDTGAIIDAILHDTFKFHTPHPRRPGNLPTHPSGDAGPLGAAACPPVREALRAASGTGEAQSSVDPFHSDWPHW